MHLIIILNIYIDISLRLELNSGKEMKKEKYQLYYKTISGLYIFIKCPQVL